MYLEKLFKAQKKLDDRIVKRHYLHDNYLLDYKILALQVELGELANEWRGFKFWSEDQKPRVELSNGICRTCGGSGVPIGITGESGVDCWDCGGAGEKVKNPLLEEYVDCLHFILSIGNELGMNEVEVTCNYTEDCSVGTFNKLFENTGDLRHSLNHESRETTEHVYKILFELFVGLGELHLGLTWEQIEQAYYDKNKVNHERQDNGY